MVKWHFNFIYYKNPNNHCKKIHELNIIVYEADEQVIQYFNDIALSIQSNKIDVFDDLLQRIKQFQNRRIRLISICTHVKLRKCFKKAFLIQDFHIINNMLLFINEICNSDEDLVQYFSKDSFLFLALNTLYAFGYDIIEALSLFLSVTMIKFDNALFKKYEDFVVSNSYNVLSSKIYLIFSSLAKLHDILQLLPCISSFEHNDYNNAVLMLLNIINLGKTNEQKKYIFDAMSSFSFSFLNYIFKFLKLFNRKSLIYALKIINFYLSIDFDILKNQDFNILIDFINDNDTDIQIEICNIIFYLLTSDETAEIILNSNINLIPIIFSFVKGSSFELKKKSLIVLCMSIFYVKQNEMDFLIQNNFMEELVSFADPDDLQFGKIILKCIITQLNKFEQLREYILPYVESLQNFYRNKDRTIDLYFYIINSYYLKDHNI